MLNFDDYKVDETKFSFPSLFVSDYQAKRAECLQEKRRLYEQFKQDALKDVGLANHPKRDLIFDRAWADGHAEGFYSVFNHLEYLAEFVDQLGATEKTEMAVCLEALKKERDRAVSLSASAAESNAGWSKALADIETLTAKLSVAQHFVRVLATGDMADVVLRAKCLVEMWDAE